MGIVFEVHWMDGINKVGLILPACPVLVELLIACARVAHILT